MSLKISAFDITNGWSADQYSLQKGSTVRLSVNVCESKVESIEWRFGNTANANSQEFSPKLVFVTDNNVPGEGYVNVSVFVTLRKPERKLNAARSLLLVPRIDCETLYQKPCHTCQSRYVDLVGVVLCEALALGDPFGGPEDFACGGACLQDCPRYEVRIDPLSPTRVGEYGMCCVSANKYLYGPDGANDTCIDLYKEDLLGRNSRYPPVQASVCVMPWDACVRIDRRAGFQRRIHLGAVSQYLMPETAHVEWEIRDIDSNKLLWTQDTGPCIGLLYDFCRAGRFLITAEISVPCCDTVSTSAHLCILEPCCESNCQDDYVSYPKNESAEDATHTGSGGEEGDDDEEEEGGEEDSAPMASPP